MALGVPRNLFHLGHIFMLENPPFEDVFHIELNMGIFQCHVRFQACIYRESCHISVFFLIAVGFCSVSLLLSSVGFLRKR